MAKDPGPIPGLPGIHLRRPRGVANFIKTIVTHPCADPWFVLIETFLPAALKLGWTLTAPDWEDILRGYAEGYARLGKGGRGGRKGHAPRVQLPVRGPVLPYQVSNLLRTTLFITKPLETLGWWWLVWNATDEFWSDWNSLLLHNAYCTADPTTGPLQQYSNDLNVFFSPGQQSAGLPLIEQDRAGWAHNAFGCNVPGGAYAVVFTAQWTRDASLGELPGCKLWVECDGAAPGLRYVESEEFTLTPGSSVGCTVTARFWNLAISGSITWGVTGLATPGATLHGTGRVIVMGI